MPYAWGKEGRDLLKSILVQCPLFVLPLFDLTVSQIIGLTTYQNYALIYKYVMGFLVFAFSYSQFTLAFRRSELKLGRIAWQLVLLTPVLAVLCVQESRVAFVFLVAILAYAINISSLYLRKMLLEGISLKFSFVGLAAVLGYRASLELFEKDIRVHAGVFIVAMYAAVATPVLIHFVKSRVQRS